jgi:hypothetical protein
MTGASYLRHLARLRASYMAKEIQYAETNAPADAYLFIMYSSMAVGLKIAIDAYTPNAEVTCAACHEPELSPVHLIGQSNAHQFQPGAPDVVVPA